MRETVYGRAVQIKKKKTVTPENVLYFNLFFNL